MKASVKGPRGLALKRIACQKKHPDEIFKDISIDLDDFLQFPASSHSLQEWSDTSGNETWPQDTMQLSTAISSQQDFGQQLAYQTPGQLYAAQAGQYEGVYNSSQGLGYPESTQSFMTPAIQLSVENNIYPRRQPTKREREAAYQLETPQEKEKRLKIN